MHTPERPLVGVLPAAGRGSRLLAHGGEKELLPVGHRVVDGPNGPMRTPRRVIEYVCDSMIAAGVTRIVVITSPVKIDRIAEHLASVYEASADVAHVVLNDSPSMPHSIASAHAWLEGADVVMGMPDTIPMPGDSFTQLLSAYRRTDADLSLGLYRTDTPHRFGMVEIDDDERVIAHADKPTTWSGDLTWGIAAWNPRFTELIQRVVRNHPDGARELPLGGAFDEAMVLDYDVRGHPLDGGRYHDIGDYDAYQATVAELRDDPGSFAVPTAAAIS